MNKKFSIVMPVPLLKSVDDAAAELFESRTEFFRVALKERLAKLKKEKSCNSQSNPTEVSIEQK